MEIHKPKAWHGAREFLKEYLIIVVGVLTALAAEQGVEWLHWRHEVQVAREAVAFDLKRLVGAAAAQDAMSPCTGRRLREVGAAIDQAAASRRLPPMGWNGAPPRSSWHMRSWSALLAGQTLAHFPNHEQIILAGLAAYSDRISSVQLQEVDDWATLHMLVGPGRATTDPEIAAARLALVHAYQHADQQKGLSQGVETLVADSGLLTAREIDRAYRDGIAAVSGVGGFCGPIPPAPASAADELGRFLAKPPVQPGDSRWRIPGVGQALTTER